jgi:hypothetical protein
MKLTTLALSLMAIAGAGWAAISSANPVAISLLPDCFVSNYDAQQDLFTLKNTARDFVNQQCLLTVGPRGSVATRSGLVAGRYEISIANGGGGGAGGTRQSGNRGGAGGGGAGASEAVTRVDLAEGSYRLTIGAGGPGGNACVSAPFNMGGGPGWPGSPTNIVRIATGEVVAGTPGAESFARSSRAQHDQSSGLKDGHGGSGPGQASGGNGGTSNSVTGTVVLAESGQGRSATGAAGMDAIRGENADRWLAGGGSGPTVSGNGGFEALASAGFDAPTARITRTNVASRTGGIPGGNEDPLAAGGGGGATSRGDGGGGGGEKSGHPDRPPERGMLGSGGGGGQGSSYQCDAGARGGHGFIALRPI